MVATMWGGAPAPRLAPWPAFSGPFRESAKPTRGSAAAQGGRPAKKYVALAFSPTFAVVVNFEAKTGGLQS